VGDSKGEKVFIPHLGLDVAAIESNGIEFKHTQFPVKPAFAMTVNKAQGQSLLHVDLYLWDSVFTHGQLYVALSRASSFKGIHIVARYNRIKKRFATQNVVYKEVMEQQVQQLEDAEATLAARI